MIACLYPRPLLFPRRDSKCLVAVNSGPATCASALVARSWRAVRVLLAPKLYFIFFGAFDTSFAHLDVVLDLSLRELAVLPENDIEAQTENAQSYKYKRR